MSQGLGHASACLLHSVVSTWPWCIPMWAVPPQWHNVDLRWVDWMRWVGGGYGVKTEAITFSEMRQRSKGMRLSSLAVQTCTSNAAHYSAGVSIIGFSCIGLSTRSQDLCSWSNIDPIFLWAPFPSGHCLFSTVHTMCRQHGVLPASFDINRPCLLDTILHEHGLDLGVLKAHPLHLTECLLAVNRFWRGL